MLPFLIDIQRNENHEPIGTDGSRATVPETFTAPATTTASSDLDFDLVAFGQSLKFYKQGLSGKSLAAIAAIRNQTTLSRRCNCPGPSVATKTVMAALAIDPVGWLPIIKTAPAAAVAAVPACRSIDLLARLQGCGLTSRAAATTTRAKNIQAFQAERTAAAPAPASGACNDGKTGRNCPRPLEVL